MVKYSPPRPFQQSLGLRVARFGAAAGFEVFFVADGIAGGTFKHGIAFALLLRLVVGSEGARLLFVEGREMGEEVVGRELSVSNFAVASREELSDVEHHFGRRQSVVDSQNGGRHGFEGGVGDVVLPTPQFRRRIELDHDPLRGHLRRGSAGNLSERRSFRREGAVGQGEERILVARMIGFDQAGGIVLSLLERGNGRIVVVSSDLARVR